MRRIASIGATVALCASGIAMLGTPAPASASLGCTSGYFCWWAGENYNNPYYKAFSYDNEMQLGASYYNDSSEGNIACLYEYDYRSNYLGYYLAGYHTPKSAWADNLRSFIFERNTCP